MYAIEEYKYIVSFFIINHFPELLVNAAGESNMLRAFQITNALTTLTSILVMGLIAKYIFPSAI